jgi:hypothetical protein
VVSSNGRTVQHSAAGQPTFLCHCKRRTYYHDLLVAGYSSHNVFANGSGIDLCLDHHGGAPHNNLWTDIDLVRAVPGLFSEPLS